MTENSPTAKIRAKIWALYNCAGAVDIMDAAYHRRSALEECDRLDVILRSATTRVERGNQS